MNINIEKSKIFIKCFLNTYFPNQTLEEQISNFKYFNFEVLRSNKKYGKCTKDFDCDDTEIARHIFFLLWHDSEDNKYKLPNLKSVDDIGSGCKNQDTGEEFLYRGDTINTYATVLGDNNDGFLIFFENPSDYERTLVNNFRQNYLTIGNFIILPEQSCNGANFNTMRGGTSKYHDFFDLFLYTLFETKDFDCLKDKNKFYFNSDFKPDIFAHINFLDMYFINNKPRIIFQHTKDNDRFYTYYWWTNNEKTEEFKQNYRNFVTDYIEHVNSIIDYRANKICEILKERLN